MIQRDPVPYAMSPAEKRAIPPTDPIWRALNNLTLACEVALDPSTNQGIARDVVGQRTREARQLMDRLSSRSSDKGLIPS